MRETARARNARHARERAQFVRQLREAGHLVVEEHLFDCRPKTVRRRWRFDIAVWITKDDTRRRIGIEIEGFGRGHQSDESFRQNMDKYLEAFAQGWELVRMSWAQIGDGSAISAMVRAGVVPIVSMSSPYGERHRGVANGEAIAALERAGVKVK